MDAKSSQKTSDRPILGITMGDPAGIGPEISVEAVVNFCLHEVCRPFIVGSAQVLKKAQGYRKITADIHVIANPSDGLYAEGTIDVLDLDNIDVDTLVLGQVQGQCGQASFEYIKKAAELALHEEIAAIVTAPINKEAIKAAGVPYIGHTEMLAALGGAEREMTMFSIEGLKIFFLTRHVPLIEACRKIADQEFVLKGIKQAYEALEKLLGHHPTLAVAGLNPHAGEGGLLGREEIESLRPAVEKANALGMEVFGPIPADSVFHLAHLGRYDAVLSLYHDQGHIAAKMLDFEKTVAVTLGLPFLRTSVDHGTAFDIAGKGTASAVSLVEAIKEAAKYAHLH